MHVGRYDYARKYNINNTLLYASRYLFTYVNNLWKTMCKSMQLGTFLAQNTHIYTILLYTIILFNTIKHIYIYYSS